MIAFRFLLATALVAFTSSLSDPPKNNNNNNNNTEDNDNNNNGDYLGAFVAPAAASKFVDDLLDSVRPHMEENHDPAALPEVGFGIKKQLLLVVVEGEVKIFDGWLAGMSTLHRTGDAHVIRTTGGTSNGCMVMMDAHLGLGNLLGHYKAKAQFMHLGPSFDLTILLPTVSIAISLQQDVNQVGSSPAVAFLDIEHIGNIEVKLEGYLGVLDWILNKVTSFVGNVIKGFVANLLESRVRRLLADQLKERKVDFSQFGCTRRSTGWDTDTGTNTGTDTDTGTDTGTGTDNRTGTGTKT